MTLGAAARPVKVAAGQADGIQPRTLEVLQVNSTLLDTVLNGDSLDV